MSSTYTHRGVSSDRSCGCVQMTTSQMALQLGSPGRISSGFKVMTLQELWICNLCGVPPMVTPSRGYKCVQRGRGATKAAPSLPLAAWVLRLHGRIHVNKNGTQMGYRFSKLGCHTCANWPAFDVVGIHGSIVPEGTFVGDRFLFERSRARIHQFPFRRPPFFCRGRLTGARHAILRCRVE